MNTPWGQSQHQTRIAEGITRLDTASHGGYHLSSDRMAEFDRIMPGVCLWAGAPWFEEDCDWALVALAFPDYFDSQSIYHAVQAVQGRTDLPVTYWSTREGRHCLGRAEAFRKTIEGKWATGAMGSTWPAVGIAVGFRQVGTGATRQEILKAWPTKIYYTEAEIEAERAG